jgi:hypothetical protein
MPRYTDQLAGLQHTAADERSAKRHLVRILEIAPRRKPARGPGNRHAKGRQKAMQVRRSRFSREVEIRGDDHLLRAVSLHAFDELADFELIGPNSFDW